MFKVLLILGVILIIISAIFMLISSEENKYNVLSQTFLALSIILIAFSAIIYFIKRQFDKLANIADDIEKGIYDEEECSEENNIEKL